MIICTSRRLMATNKNNLERYRSGHNEAVLKTVWRKPQGFESLPLRHNEKGRTCCGLFRSGDGRLIRTLLHCGSNGYDDAARRRRVLNPFLSARMKKVVLRYGLFLFGDGRTTSSHSPPAVMARQWIAQQRVACHGAGFAL